MAKNDIGPRIGIDGESEFRKQITQINTSLKTLGTEMKVVTSEFADNAKSEEALTAKNKVLNKNIDELNQKLELQNKALEYARQHYDENSDEVQRWQQEVNKTQTALNNAENELRRNTTAMDELGDETKDTGENFEDATKQASTFGDILKGTVLGDAIIKGVEALANGIKKVAKAAKDAVVDAAEYGDEINTLSKKTGLSTDTLQEFKYMEDLVDTDLSTITGSLSKLTKNMNSARGGTGDTADAFKTLGVSITDSNGALRDNETVFYELIDALGKVDNDTERDALAMQIFGKSAQELNPLIEAGSDQLAAYAQEAHDVGYVLDKDTIDSLNDVSDSMSRVKSVTTSVKNQLAGALAPVLEDVAAKFQDWVATVDWDAVGQKLNEIVGKVQQFVQFFVDNGDYIIAIIAGIAAGFVAWEIVGIVISVVEALKKAKEAEEGLSIAQAALNLIMEANPIGIVIAAITALVAAIVVLWNKNEKFRDFVKGCWESIKNFFVDAWHAIQNAFSNVGEWFTEKFNAAFTGIKNAFSTIGDFFRNLWENIKAIFNNAKEVFSNIGQAIVQGIWQGIQNAASWFTSQVKNFFGNIVSGVKRVLGIKSPSKVFASIGEMCALGLGVGFDDEISDVERDINRSVSGLVPSVSGSSSVYSSGASSASGMAAAIKSALNGAAVIMDGKKVGTLVTTMQNNATRSRGAAVLI